jgi:sulfate adenylyltransferase
MNKSESTKYPEVVLNDRQLCDLELLLNGGFAPLKGFLREKDYKSVVENMRLSSGKLWAMPIVLSIPNKEVSKYQNVNNVTLKNSEGMPLAILDDIELYAPDLKNECEKVYGSSDTNHPYVKIVLGKSDVHYMGGELRLVQMPRHFDFKEYRLTPAETKQYFQENGWTKVVGFQTRNPMHRSHYELTKYALSEAGKDAKLLLHPVVGITQECDIQYHTRVRCYRKLIKHYPENSALLSLLTLSMRMAGPREAVWHAQVRKNFGCTHFVVGRDHAGPSYKKKDGSDFYGPYDAQELLMANAREIGIEVITSKMIVFAVPKGYDGKVNEDNGEFVRIDQVNKDTHDVMNISGTKQREMLANGEQIPSWFSFPEVVEELQYDFKKKCQQGFCLYFVGLSGSGKSTLANAVLCKLRELERHRQITILDGDIIRRHLSKGLGFNRDDRSINVQRIGYVASEVVKHGGIVFSANIAPYNTDRALNRELISAYGHYIEVFVDTPISECEKRDAKGLYQLARQGVIKEFTGISDPFEEPEKAELHIDGTGDLDQNVDRIINHLCQEGLIC